ncbi:hypothetical protein GQ44DRAFT_635390, partial [Phaeosphaeriaceae sp. PMI808]
HLDTLFSICHLASNLSYQYRYDESSALYERAYAAYQIVRGTNPPFTLSCLQQYTEAKMHAAGERSLSVRFTETLGGDINVHTTKSSNLAHVPARTGIRRSKL